MRALTCFIHLSPILSLSFILLFAISLIRSLPSLSLSSLATDVHAVVVSRLFHPSFLPPSFLERVRRAVDRLVRSFVCRVCTRAVALARISPSSKRSRGHRARLRRFPLCFPSLSFSPPLSLFFSLFLSVFKHTQCCQKSGSSAPELYTSCHCCNYLLFARSTVYTLRSTRD